MKTFHVKKMTGSGCALGRILREARMTCECREHENDGVRMHTSSYPYYSVIFLIPISNTNFSKTIHYFYSLLSSYKVIFRGRDFFNEFSEKILAIFFSLFVM